MQRFKTLPDAIALATFAHRNQQDKAGMPYIDHPLRVMATVQAMGAQPFVQMAAVLHDVTEDTAFTPEILLALGFSEAVVRLVILLDRDYSKSIHTRAFPEDATSNNEINEFYYASIKQDLNAKMIKVADIRDNLSPWRLSYLPQETQDRLRSKYARALDLLGEAL